MCGFNHEWVPDTSPLKNENKTIMENCLCRPDDGRHYVYDPKCPVHPPEDESIEELKRQIQAYETTVHNLNLQLTEKDIVIDRYIGKLNQIRALVEKV